MKRPAAAVLVLLLAACFGAGLAQRSRNASSMPPTQAPQAASQPKMHSAIDQADLLELAAVRAPADFGEQAMAHMKAITNFGPRHTATMPTPGWTQQLDYICDQLEKSGLVVERDTWTDRKELLTFTNVRAVVKGKHKDRIVLACHHDTKCTQGHADPSRNFHFVGANDGGSGVAFLLAIAPVLLQRQNEATIELLFLDGEESLDWNWNNATRALFGSKRFVQRQRDAELLGKAERIRALVLLDMVARSDLHIQEELYSTTELRRILYSSAIATGHRDRFFRMAESASDDHVPFLDVGIPAVDLIDLKDNPHWHKATDTLENCSAASLQIVGDVVLTMLPAIEAQYFGEDR